MKGGKDELEQSGVRDYIRIPLTFVSNRMQRKHRILIISLSLGLFVWVLHGLFDYLWFYSSEGTLLELLITKIPSHELYIRIFVLLIFAGFGLYVGRVLDREQKLRSELLEREKMFARTERLAQVGSWQWEVGEDRVSWSHELFRIFGLEPSLGAPSFAEHSQLYLEEDLTILRTAVRKAVEAGKPYDLRLRFQRSDGEIRYCRVQGYPERDQDRKIVRLHGFLQDITEQKEAEDRLRRRNEFIETIMDNLPIGLAVNQYGEGKALYHNRRFEEIYGWPSEELPDVDTFFERVYPDQEYREQIRGVIESDISSGDPERMVWEDIEITASDGSKRIVTAKNIPVPDQELMISTVQDVTARKIAEEEKRELQAQLHQARRLEAIGQLAGGVAHDFNNILTGVQGFSELALTSLPEDSPARQDLQEILRLSLRAARLTRQLLAFGRRQTLELSTVNVNHLIRDLLRMLRRLVREDVHIELNLSPDLAPIRIDVSQFEQILTNLAINAQEAMPQGGNLVIETKVVELDEKYAVQHPEVDPGDHVMIAVSDTGVGMDEKTKRRIFEPFFSSKHSKGGTGLGLATVYGIVKQHGGNIWVYSEPGKGSTFRIYLPIATGAGEAAKSGAHIRVQEEIDLRPTQLAAILVVEDDESILDIVQRSLRAKNHTVLTAASLREAIEVSRRHLDSIDLLLTDVILPDGNGKDLWKKLHVQKPELKVLYMSGYSDNVITHHGVLEPGMAFLQKPFTTEKLLIEVQRALEKEDQDS